MNNSICTLFDNILIDIHKFKSLQYIPSDILANLNQKIQENYNNNQKKIESGERALSTYKKGMEIPFSISKRE